ncbi:MAG: hypothetical protein M1827_002986 [Pycnora praestabilis]|nr:MAG: hypothetical protein M1827_002986 [Pycnora praestabilis]
MSDDQWIVEEHVIPASHIRGFERGVRDEQTAHLRLAVKQYTPRLDGNPQVGDVTIIMGHGVGASKESYEPFLYELLNCGIRIRHLWTFDTAHHGASYVLNEDVIGDEPHWFDFARDLLQMVNHFQTLMPPPIVGIGQSWCCVRMMMAAIMHPRLFAGLVQIEAVLGTGYRFRRTPDRDHWGVLLSKRRDVWPSREIARKSLLKNPYFAAFDPRVFDRIIKYNLRDLPPVKSSSSASDAAALTAIPVTLTTPKAQEVYTMMRPDPPFPGFPEGSDYSSRGDNATVVPGFYRGESAQVVANLPFLLPSILYVWGSESLLFNSKYRVTMVEATGTGAGGNGGTAAGKVKEVVVQGATHPLPLEKPREAAEAVAPWLKEEMRRWDKERESRKTQPKFETTLSPDWVKRIAKL